MYVPLWVADLRVEESVVAALEERRVDDILIESLARVLQAPDEVPAGVDLTLSSGRRGAACLRVRAPGAAFRNGDALVYWSQAGVTQTVAQPRARTATTTCGERPSASSSARGSAPRGGDRGSGADDGGARASRWQ
jgi:hypothetical protein